MLRRITTTHPRAGARGRAAPGRAGAPRRAVGAARVLRRAAGAARHPVPILCGPGEDAGRRGHRGPARPGGVERRLRHGRPRGGAADDARRPLPDRLAEQGGHERGRHDPGRGGTAPPRRARLQVHPELRHRAGGRGHRQRPCPGAGPSRRHHPPAADPDGRALVRHRIAHPRRLPRRRPRPRRGVRLVPGRQGRADLRHHGPPRHPPAGGPAGRSMDLWVRHRCAGLRRGAGVRHAAGSLLPAADLRAAPA